MSLAQGEVFGLHELGYVLRTARIPDFLFLKEQVVRLRVQFRSRGIANRTSREVHKSEDRDVCHSLRLRGGHQARMAPCSCRIESHAGR
jgi:hypothetical protein